MGFKVRKNKIRPALHAWVNNLKRKHDFLLYWNIDSPVLTLSPIILENFSMILSTYTINYLSNNYAKIKAESESVNENFLYTLQI